MTLTMIFGMDFQEPKGYFMELMLSEGVFGTGVYIQEVEEELMTLQTKMDMKKLKITTTKEYPTWIQATMRVVK